MFKLRIPDWAENVCIAQLIDASALAACVHVRAEDPGSTPGADKLDTGYHAFGIEKEYRD